MRRSACAVRDFWLCVLRRSKDARTGRPSAGRLLPLSVTGDEGVDPAVCGSAGLHGRRSRSGWRRGSRRGRHAGHLTAYSEKQRGTRRPDPERSPRSPPAPAASCWFAPSAPVPPTTWWTVSPSKARSVAAAWSTRSASPSPRRFATPSPQRPRASGLSKHWATNTQTTQLAEKNSWAAAADTRPTRWQIHRTPETTKPPHRTTDE